MLRVTTSRNGLFAVRYDVRVDGRRVTGRIWRSGTVRPGYAAELPAALPVPVQVFLVWAAMAVRRSTAASAAAATIATTGSP